MIEDISQVVLALPEGDEFRADNPAEGITSVTITQLDATTVRVSITGEAALPTAEVVPSERDRAITLPLVELPNVHGIRHMKGGCMNSTANYLLEKAVRQLWD